MIKLNKLDEPSVLRDNKANWTREYQEALASGGNISGTLRTRYRHPEIKAQILRETSDKCAYCESKITHTYPGDIEHILPKSVFPEFIFEWDNLTLACGECNRRKLDYSDASNPLLNPYKDEPEEHLVPIGALIKARAGDRLGRITEQLLELNRPKLIERRRERIDELANLAHLYAIEPEGKLKALLWKQLQQEVAKDKEYSFIAKAFVELVCDCSLS